MEEEYKNEQIHVWTYEDAAIFANATIFIELSNQQYGEDVVYPVVR